jgi:hypothetical protein
LQPGLLLDQPLKSMRANSFQLINFCCTRTVPAAETKSIGLQADARVVMVFVVSPRQLYRDMTNPARLSGPRHLDSFIVTPNARPSIGTLQKRMPTLTRTATNQTAGPLAFMLRPTWETICLKRDKYVTSKKSRMLTLKP